ncbi:synaptotagmin-like protein 2 isoform X1 [Danio rerio]|uniref:Synaptotagmin-like protein 1 n=1 Tax=Danio rerio TaxID=7955 RepID=A0A8M2BH78_DANRE|nr:synaptotagmin-like protein 1 isoform X1 [Danio rerio]|eukprot:XP_005169912.1 synaptotagmin-like protein 1 isoform X1 [Danio rerio]
MKPSKSALGLLDLSFLSAEEEAAIRQVLLRDEDLKRLESGRVRKLRQSVPDLQQLKNLTGEWFEELRIKRYGQQTDVTAVVRTSMRWKKTAVHKPNPFLNDKLDENKEHDKDEHNTRPNASADPRLIHPALSKETYHQHTHKDFIGDVETPSAPSVSNKKEKLRAETDANPFLNGTDPGHKSTKTQPKELSGGQTTTVFPFSSPVQDTKPERSTTKNPEPRRKVSLPPALQRDQSFEENWVKISLEPNTVKPVHDENNSSGIKLKEVKPHIKNIQDTSSPETSHTESKNVLLKSGSPMKEFHFQPQTSLAFTSHGPELTTHSAHGDSKEVNKFSNAFQNSTSTDQQCLAELTFRESESDKAGPLDSANVRDKGSLASRDIVNDEASSDRKGGEGKNVSIGFLVETDMDQAVEHLTGEEEINKHFSAEEESQSPSLKWGIEMDSHEFPQVKDASSDFGDDVQVQIEKKNENELLYQTTGVKLCDKTVQSDLDSCEDKVKLRSYNNQTLSEISQDIFSMTDDGKLVHIREDKHMDKSVPEPIKPAHPSDDVAGFGQDSSEIKVDVDSAETKSDVLLNVLARAQKTRPPVLQNITNQEPNLEGTDDTVPSIVIVPSESPDPAEMKGNKRGALVLEALLQSSTAKNPSYIADAWEDEGVNSDDDDTSLSSYGSDLSSRKGFSASALSLTDRTGSLLSVYSDAGDFGTVEVQGSVEFAVMYSPVGELIIMIEQCQDLAIANPRKQRTDPYVKTYLYPDKSRRSKRKTTIKKRTVNPVFVESLRYKVNREELPEKSLNLSVWHNDSRGRNVFLGQVELSFRTWDWGHEALTWYNLQPKTSENAETKESNGLLSVSLKYVPSASTGGSKSSTGEIHVWLREAKELRRLKPQGVDSFVKCYILPDTRKKSRQKTRVVKKTQDPVYNHAMVYDGFKTGEVTEACCELTVWDHNTLANQFLGGVRLSLGTGQSYGKKVDWMDSVDEEVQIWKRMLASPNSWVEGELPLRSAMTPRKSTS